MSVIVTDTGFGPDEYNGPDTGFLDIRSDADPCGLVAGLTAGLADRLLTLELIRIDFASFADGRGFSLARRLRQSGYSGRLRARGNVLADQYAMARRSGFDEVEIDNELAQRQPQDQWLARSDWRAHDYQARLRG